MAAPYLGLISGTSADAVDAALVTFEDRPQVIHAEAFALPGELRGGLLGEHRRFTPAQLLQLDAALGEAFAEAALAVLAHAGVDASAVAAIGSHGQTLWHSAEGTLPGTLQIADPSRIAERTGITTVADFRRRDMAAGGQGAPLAPAFHAAWLRSPAENRGVLNLGGIANLTVLPADTGTPVLGFDTGPASTLMDAWCQRHLGRPYDEEGRWAAGGSCQAALLERLLQEPYFKQPPPKSTGPEQFNLGWLHRRGGELIEQLDAADVQATLLELTAITAADAIRHAAPAIARVLICGGGVHNTTLMRRLTGLLPGVVVESSAVHGLDPDYVEAATFAWLAQQTLTGRPGNLPSVTGARGPRILGAIYPGTAWTKGEQA